MRSFLNPQAKVEAQEAVIGIAFTKPGFDKYRAYERYCTMVDYWHGRLLEQIC
jgi:hypothetical protein